MEYIYDDNQWMEQIMSLSSDIKEVTVIYASAQVSKNTSMTRTDWKEERRTYRNTREYLTFDDKELKFTRSLSKPRLPKYTSPKIMSLNF